MKSKALLIEALEPRIAPALLVNGGNLLGGGNNPTTGETSTGNNTVTLVKVLSGQALVFYHNGEITGISVGKHTKLDITGDVFGDIVTNLGPDGRLTDTDNNASNGEDGGLLTNYGIKGITTHPLVGQQKGSIFGRIIAGGQINNVNIAGQVGGIYAGDGIFRDGSTASVSLSGADANSIAPGIQDTFTFHQGASAPNGNAAIKNVTVATAAQLEIFAGSGSNGGAGSGITNVTIAKTLTAQSDQPVVFLHAGDGGANSGSGNGGAGGSITSFNDQGSTAYVKLQTGDGGSASGGGDGGDGGSLLTSTIVSSATRYDLLMGVGGNGQHGGAGGSIQTLSFTNTITGGKSLVATADLNGDGVSDVILLNTLTGESVISLGSTTADQPNHVNFGVVAQTEIQADGTQIQTPFLPAEGSTPTSLVVTDLNHDGLPDFVVSYASTDSLGVYTNHGNGTFGAARLNLAVSPTNLVAGDFSGSGLGDLAIVSSSAGTTNTGGPLSEVFIAHDSAAGALTVDTTPVASFGGVSTAAAGAVGHDATTDAVSGVNLYVGFQSGDIMPVLFRNGTATLGTDIPAFRSAALSTDPNSVPVDSVDATETSLLAFSHDTNAVAIKNGDTTLLASPEVIVYGVNAATGATTSNRIFNPDGGTTDAHFLAGSALVGTVAPAAVTVWGFTNASTDYTPLSTLSSDGALSNFASSHLGNSFQIAAAGAANNRFFFTEGSPGSTDGINAFAPTAVPFRPRVISFDTGNGGGGDTLVGGDGGAIKGLKYTETLGSGVLEAGGAYTINLLTGQGGTSNASQGGNGGSISSTDLSLNPAYYTFGDGIDDTTTATFQTGAGGQGTSGGDGGSLSKVTSTTVFSHHDATGAALDAVALRLLTGDGGVGTAQAGGAGGSITLAGQSAISGISFLDPDATNFGQNAALEVKAGNGGQGVTAGGAGGSLTSIGSQNVTIGGLNYVGNELFDSTVTSGGGGEATNGKGGAGGVITSTNIAVEASILVEGGDGGVGHGGVGGVGGKVSKSTVGSVEGDPIRNFGVLVHGGAGGGGDLGGGNGGGIKQVGVNSPANPELFAAVVVAGNGGDALSNGTGGRGGNVQSITQTKDVNSAINVIQAGNGGSGLGNSGGAGGSVKNLDTVGFIGLPSTSTDYLGVFNSIASPEVAALFDYAQVPQGIFAGAGAAGAANGSVLNVVARQIAAIGASVQANGHFAGANMVDNVKADVIGYETTNGTITSPAANVPTDGFILGSVVTNIATEDSGRTASLTFTS